MSGCSINDAKLAGRYQSGRPTGITDESGEWSDNGRVMQPGVNKSERQSWIAGALGQLSSMYLMYLIYFIYEGAVVELER